MTSALQKAIQKNKNALSEAKTLGQKLALIGKFYQNAYGNSFRFFHSNHRQANLLIALKDKTNAFTYQSLAAIFNSLPREGALAKALRAVISETGIESLGLHTHLKDIERKPGNYETTPYHKPNQYNQPLDVYYYPIRHHLRPGNLNQGIAYAMLALDNTKGNVAQKTRYTLDNGGTLAIEKMSTLPPSPSLSDKLAWAAQQYLNQHQKATPWWWIRERHTHQKEAFMLRQLQGKSDDEATLLVSDILLTLKKGALSKAIWEILNEPGHESAKKYVRDEALTMPKREALAYL